MSKNNNDDHPKGKPFEIDNEEPYNTTKNDDDEHPAPNRDSWTENED